MPVNKSKKVKMLKKPQQTVNGFKIEKIVEKMDYKNSEHKQMLYRVRWPNSWEHEENVPEDVRNGVINDSDETNKEPIDVKNILWTVFEVLGTEIRRGKKMYHIKWQDSWLWEKDLG